jgi:hypothetical protein
MEGGFPFRERPLVSKQQSRVNGQVEGLPGDLI